MGRAGAGRVLSWLGWALACLIAGGFIAIFFAWPVANLIGRGFTAGGGISLAPFAATFADARTWQVIGQTLLQATLGTVLSVVLGLPGAYVVSRVRFRGRALLRAWITVPFVLPTVVVGTAFRSLFGEGGLLGFLGLDQSLTAIVVALVFFNYAVVVRTVSAMWERIDERAVHAAKTLGASPARAFCTVTLPQLAPAIAAAAGIVFLFCSTAFGVVMVLGGRRFANLEAEIYRNTADLLRLDTAAVLSIAQLVVISVVLWLVARLRRRREIALDMTSVRASAHRTSRADLPAIGVTAAVIIVLQVLPLGSLLIRSFRSTHGWGLHNYQALSTTGARGGLSVTVWEAMGASVRIALQATLIALVIGLLLVAILSRRPRGRVLRAGISGLDSFVMLPLGVSAVTVGFGLLITMNRPLGFDVDLRRSGVLIVIAQAMVAIPLVVRVILPVVRAIDVRQRQAAASLGAGPARIMATVDWPIAARSVGLGAGFALAVSLGEFGATAFLVRPDVVTVPVVIYQLLGRQGADNFGMAVAAAVVLGTLTTIVMLAAERFRNVGAGEF